MVDKPGQVGKECILDAVYLSEWSCHALRLYIRLESTETMDASMITTTEQPGH